MRVLRRTARRDTAAATANWLLESSKYSEYNENTNRHFVLACSTPNQFMPNILRLLVECMIIT